MRVAILTSHDNSIASHHAEAILRNKPHQNFELVAAILAKNPPKKNLKFYRRKLKKALKIGLWGVRNGIQMRSWFGELVEKELNCRALSEVCGDFNIEFVETNGLNSQETKQALSRLNLEVAVSLGNGFIAPSVFKIPRRGMINIHHEILPQYQNAQSVIWQLYNGSKQTGYTIHEIDRQIDCGRILYQEHLPIQFSDSLKQTVVQTHIQQWEASARGLQYTLTHFSELKATSTEQGKGGHYTTPSRRQFEQIMNNFELLKTEGKTVS